jgi:hypothetical protein
MLQIVALEHVLGLTASVEGTRSLSRCPAITRQLVLLLGDSAQTVRKVSQLLHPAKHQNFPNIFPPVKSDGLNFAWGIFNICHKFQLNILINFFQIQN